MLFIDGHSIILINFIALQSTLIMGSRMKYFLTIYRYAVQSMQFLIICWSSPNWTKWSETGTSNGGVKTLIGAVRNFF